MFVNMRAKKTPAGIKLQYFCQYGDRKKKNNLRTKLSIYILDTCLAMSGSFISQPDRNIRIGYCPRWHENNQDSKAG
jgi:hypothetical protein